MKAALLWMAMGAVALMVGWVWWMSHPNEADEAELAELRYRHRNGYPLMPASGVW